MSSRTTTAFKMLDRALTPALRTRRDPEAAARRVFAKAEAGAGSSFETTDRDQQWVEDFRVLLHCVAAVADLRPSGWVGALRDTRLRAENYLRIRDLHRTHPDIGHEEIAHPIFVVGPYRTGTTLAHHVLANSPRTQGPRLVDMVRPGLPVSSSEETARIKAVRRQYSATAFAPDFDYVHPLDPVRAEESMFVLPHGGFRLLFQAPMADYREWLARRDMTDDYRYLKRTLQVLQYRRPRLASGAAPRWVLKYPLDLGQMATIKGVFPDATFVWTHRSPITMMGSLCSLAELSQSLVRTRIDRPALGADALELMVEAVEAGRAFRRAHPEAVIDVPYHRLEISPDQYVPQLYEQLGLPFTLEDAQHLATALARPGSPRRHEYNLRDYGLTDDQIRTAFGTYLEMVERMNFA